MGLWFHGFLHSHERPQRYPQKRLLNTFPSGPWGPSCRPSSPVKRTSGGRSLGRAPVTYLEQSASLAKPKERSCAQPNGWKCLVNILRVGVGVFCQASCAGHATSPPKSQEDGQEAMEPARPNSQPSSEASLMAQRPAKKAGKPGFQNALGQNSYRLVTRF